MAGRGIEPLDAIIRKLDAIANGSKMDDIVGRASAKQVDYMAELNREQLYAGETVSGSMIKPKYRPKTVAYKIKKGQPSDRVTLFDEGHYHAGIRFEKFTRYYRGRVEDVKELLIEEKYGSNLIGLQAESKALVSQKMLPDMLSMIEKYLGI